MPRRTGGPAGDEVPSLRVLPLASPLPGHAREPWEPAFARFAQQSGVALQPASPEELREEPLPVLFLLTGGTEGRALAFAATTPAPLLLLARPSHNALPAALEALARLREEGRKAWLIPEGAAGELPRFAEAARIARELRGKKLGLVGGASPWLVASTPDPRVLGEKLGIHVVPLPLEHLRARIPAEPPEHPRGPGVGVGPNERAMAGRVYAGLRALLAEAHLSALSIACFELLHEECTACWALARLASEGVPSGCEGDLPGVLALWISQILTGRPGFLANPADVDLPRGKLLLAHCTAPLALVEDWALRTHFESGRGLAVAGRLTPGAYTLVRFGGKRLEKAFLVEGTVLAESPAREDLCRTQVWFKMPKGAVRKLLREPLGNHHILLPGHHRAVLALFHAIFLAE